jgi:hypothetical protein
MGSLRLFLLLISFSINAAAESVIEACCKKDTVNYSLYYLNATISKSNNIEVDSTASAGVVASLYHDIATFNFNLETNTGDEQLVKYAFLDFGNGTQGLRLGRVQHLLGFYNQVRGIPHIEDFVYHPPALYLDYIEQFERSGDGVQIYKFFDVNFWELGMQAYIAKPVILSNDDLKGVFFKSNLPGKITDKSLMQGFSVNLKSPDRTDEFRFDTIRLDFDYDSYMEPFVKSGKLDTTIYTFGYRRYFDSSDLTIEVMGADQKGPVWESFLALTNPPDKKEPMGLMLSYRKRFSPANSINAWVDIWCSDPSDCSGKDQAEFMGLPEHLFYVKSIGINWKHHFTKELCLSSQYVYGVGSNAHKWDEPRHKYWDIIQFSLTRVF